MKTLSALATALFLAAALMFSYEESVSSQNKRLDIRMAPVTGKGASRGQGKEGQNPDHPKPLDYGGVKYPGHGVQNERVRQAIAKEPSYVKGWNFKFSTSPKKGETGVHVDHSGSKIHVHYGDSMAYHADAWRYHCEAYPDARDRGYFPVSSKQKKDEQRGRALDHLPDGYGHFVHRDEEAPASMDWTSFAGLLRSSRYGYNPLKEDTTNTPVPEGESQRQAMMLRYAVTQSKETGYAIYFHDHTVQRASLRVQPNRGPDLPNNNDGRGKPFHTTNENPGYQRRIRRDQPQINSINGQSSDQMTADLTIADLQKQYEENLLAYRIISDNATDLLWPVIDSVLALSDLPIIHDMAFSLLQIVNVPYVAQGPFMYGMTNFGAYEDEITRNMTDEQQQNDPNVQLMYATHGVLIRLYEEAWANGTAAANATGYLGDLEVLASHLVTDNNSVISQAAMEVIPGQNHGFVDYFYANVVDDLSSTASGGVTASSIYSTSLPSRSGGAWLTSSATGTEATDTPASTGTAPIKNGKLAKS